MPNATVIRPAHLWVPDQAVSSSGAEAADLAAMAGLVLDGEQRIAIDAILSERPDRLWAAIDSAIIEPRQNGKGLDCETPIPTPAGWVTIGDLRPGDVVFDEIGRQCNVTFVSERRLLDCYRVDFSDGTSITADGDHLWTVFDVWASGGSRKAKGRWLTAATRDLLGKEQIGNRGKLESRYRLPEVGPLECAHAGLPIDPWLFGAWLGDGTSKGSIITVGAIDLAEMVAAIEATGATVKAVEPKPGVFSVRFRLNAAMRDGFQSRMQRLDLWGNKHIPTLYLRASVNQRMALLQGLMDTDGSVSVNGTNGTNRQCEFSVVNERLARDVLELCRSLGIRCGWAIGDAKLNGVKISDRYRITFTTDLPVFRLTRKAITHAGQGPLRPRARMVRKIEAVAPRPTVCIQVDSESSLFRAGESMVPTHNTVVLQAIALADLFLFDARLVTWSAHLFPTAQEAFRDLENLIDGTPEFSRRVKRIDRANGEEGIELIGDRRLKFKARSKTGGRGLTGDRVILDEAFAIGPAEIGSLYPTLSARPNPSAVYASSAGMLGSAVLRSLRDRGRKGGDDSLVWVEWCARPGECKTDQCNHLPGADGCILDDRERWIEANPAAAGISQRITVRYLESERRTLPPEEFMRERLGWWEDPIGGESGISQEAWARCANRDALIDEPCTVAVDVAPGHVAGAILTCGDALHVVDHSPGTSWIVPRLVELDRAHDISAVGLDPSSPAAALIPDLEKAGFTVRHQSTNPNGKLILLTGREAVQACEQFLSSVLDGTLTHRDELVLNSAVEGAGRREVGDSWKWSRKDSVTDISPLAAATIARYLWVANPERGPSEYISLRNLEE